MFPTCVELSRKFTFTTKKIHTSHLHPPQTKTMSLKKIAEVNNNEEFSNTILEFLDVGPITSWKHNIIFWEYLISDFRGFLSFLVIFDLF